MAREHIKSPADATNATRGKHGLDDRPEQHEYFLKIALAVSERARCLGRHVGATLVRDGRIIATGYNGTPDHMPNCDDREKGCYRCANRDQFEPGSGYDLCICVHAEQNALLSAARFGSAVEGAVLYTTYKPCLGCAKEALQAKVAAVYYLEDWSPASRDPKVAHAYERLMLRFPNGVRKIDLPDPTLRRPSSGAPLPDTGHAPPVS